MSTITLLMLFIVCHLYVNTFYFILHFCVFGGQPGTYSMLGNCSIGELHSKSKNTFFFFFFGVLEIELRVSCLLSRHSTT
jgi:hypothetical protein